MCVDVIWLGCTGIMPYYHLHHCCSETLGLLLVAYTTILTHFIDVFWIKFNVSHSFRFVHFSRVEDEDATNDMFCDEAKTIAIRQSHIYNKRCGYISKTTNYFIDYTVVCMLHDNLSWIHANKFKFEQIMEHIVLLSRSSTPNFPI